MAENTYKISLTGEQINQRLQLIDGDASSVKLETSEVTTNNGTLATKTYVDNKVATAGGATTLEDLGITATATEINTLKGIWTAVNLNAQLNTKADIAHMHAVGALEVSDAQEGQVLRIVNGKPTWSTVEMTASYPAAEDNTF